VSSSISGSPTYRFMLLCPNHRTDPIRRDLSIEYVTLFTWDHMSFLDPMCMDHMSLKGGCSDGMSVFSI